MKEKMVQFESKIVSVKVNDKSECHYVTYKKERKRLFGLLKSLPSGYYTDGDRFLGDEEDLLNGAYTIKSCGDGDEYTFILVCENQKAYYQPYVTIKYESGNYKQLKFNTIKECNEYAKELGQKFNLLDVYEL